MARQPLYPPKKMKRNLPRRGIPTLYAGVQFRSRLEARWACFFDLCGWPWMYEPYDLNGWIPDFALGHDFGHLVEVKPLSLSSMTAWDETVFKAKSAMESNPRFNEVSFLGIAPSGSSNGPSAEAVLAFHAHQITNDGLWCFGPWLIGFGVQALIDGRILALTPTWSPPADLIKASSEWLRCAKENSFFVCDSIHCNIEDREFDIYPFSVVDHMWKKAGNYVQYKGSSSQIEKVSKILPAVLSNERFGFLRADFHGSMRDGDEIVSGGFGFVIGNESLYGGMKLEEIIDGFPNLFIPSSPSPFTINTNHGATPQ